MFGSEGQHKVEIIKAILAEPRFNTDDPEALDVALEVQTLDGTHSDWWYGELSNAYGKGNAADRKQWQLTVASLERIGWKHGTDFSDENLAELVGVITEVGVKATEKNGKTYYNVLYLGPSSFGPKSISQADRKAKLSALFGSGENDKSEPASTAVSASNPFS